MQVKLQKIWYKFISSLTVKKCSPKWPEWKNLWNKRGWPRNGCDAEEDGHTHVSAYVCIETATKPSVKIKQVPLVYLKYGSVQYMHGWARVCESLYASKKRNRSSPTLQTPHRESKRIPLRQWDQNCVENSEIRYLHHDHVYCQKPSAREVIQKRIGQMMN